MRNPGSICSSVKRKKRSKHWIPNQVGDDSGVVFGDDSGVVFGDDKLLDYR